MNNSNTTIIDDEGGHKENAIYANQTLLKTSIQQPSSSQSKRTLQIVVDQDVTPKKPSKSQVALTRKRRVLCELTEAEIQARSVPRTENVIQAIDHDTTEQQSSETHPQTAKSKTDSNSLFKAARQARQKQSISSHIGSQTLTTSRGSASDKATSSLQKTHRNLR